MLDMNPIENLRAYLDRWASALVSTQPANRPAAEQGIALAYAAAGLPPPRQIVWCDSPTAIAKQIAAARSHAIGASVKDAVFERVRAKVGTMAEIFWKEILIAATDLTENVSIKGALGNYETCKRASAAVERAVTTAANAILLRPRYRALRVLLRLRGGPILVPVSGFRETAVSPHELGTLGVYEYLHDILSCTEPMQPLTGLWMIAKSAGWIAPYENVCWISDRPAALHVDARGRLHCETGPALNYPDSWSAYAWKGVPVSQWMVENPKRITPTRITDESDPAVRNCMIEIMTPARFVDSGSVMRVAEDETGVLWRKTWHFRGVVYGSWTAVEVVNGTPEGDGTRKRYFLRVPRAVKTAREAVAWTYGLTADQYAHLEVRT